MDHQKYCNDMNVLIFGPSQSRLLHLNKSVAPLDDKRVRQAIAHAIDRDEFQALIGSDITKQLFAPVPGGFLGRQPICRSMNSIRRNPRPRWPRPDLATG